MKTITGLLLGIGTFLFTMWIIPIIAGIIIISNSMQSNEAIQNIVALGNIVGVVGGIILGGLAYRRFKR